jgi:hypothetical protein
LPSFSPLAFDSALPAENGRAGKRILHGRVSSERPGLRFFVVATPEDGRYIPRAKSDF